MTESASRRLGTAASAGERLLDAAERELAESGHAALTVRLVARRAGLSPATAYKVFASKDHLLSAVFLRHLTRLPEPPPEEGPMRERVVAFLQSYADIMAADPELRAGLRVVFMSDDPESGRIRALVTEQFERRFQAVCGADLVGPHQTTVLLAFAGAMMLAGSGSLPFTEISTRIAEVLQTLNEG